MSETSKPTIALLLSLTSLLGIGGSAGAITVVAGTGVAGYAGDGGAASAAELSQPQAVAVAEDGSLFIADAGNHRVRRVAPDGSITTAAGDGGVDFADTGYPQDATGISLAFPAGLAAGAGGSLWIADAVGQRLFRLDSDGLISLMAGTGQEGPAATDVPATASPLLYPSGMVGDGDGVLVDEMGSGRVLRFSADGSISVAADGLSSPYGLARDMDGALLIADYGAGAVLRATVPQASAAAATAPTAVAVAAALPVPVSDGDAVLPSLALPASSVAGRDGSLYIAAPDVGTVYRLAPDGTLAPFLASPQLSRPAGLYVTPDSRLLIADEGLNQVLAADLPFPAPAPGDVDGDGRVTVSDALLALRLIVGASPFDRRQFLAADVSPPAAGSGLPGDHRLTIEDAVLILRRAVGM